jgi:hypothetical protein
MALVVVASDEIAVDKHVPGKVPVKNVETAVGPSESLATSTSTTALANAPISSKIFWENSSGQVAFGSSVMHALYWSGSKNTPASKSKPLPKTLRARAAWNLMRRVADIQAVPFRKVTGMAFTCAPPLYLVLDMYLNKRGLNAHVHRHQLASYGVKYETCAFWERKIKSGDEINSRTNCKLKLDAKKQPDLVLIVKGLHKVSTYY